MVCSKRILAASIKPTTAHPTAHRQYKTILVESEQVITFPPADLVALDELVTLPQFCGGSLITWSSAIIRKLPLSGKTLYNHIESGALSVKQNIDLPKRVGNIRCVPCRSSEAAGSDTFMKDVLTKNYHELFKGIWHTRVTEKWILSCMSPVKVQRSVTYLHFDLLFPLWWPTFSQQ